MAQKITIEEAAVIYKDRFNGTGTPRSEAYKRGFGDKLQKVATDGKYNESNPFKPGTPEFDAYGYGHHHADNSINCFIFEKEDVVAP